MRYIDDYKKPSIKDKPDYFIAHVGTKDWNSEVSSKSIAESIEVLAMSIWKTLQEEKSASDGQHKKDLDLII